MQHDIYPGVWPTMITPFTPEGQLDFAALEELIPWYVERGVAGLFAVCQSSEMFHLSLKEREDLARFVVSRVHGAVPVVASGHISPGLEEQIEELKVMADTGIDAVVLVSNRLAAQDEPDEVWQKNVEQVLATVPGIRFGIYECPFPYKRLVSPELLAWCASTGRFHFLKDTSCDLEALRLKAQAVAHTQMNIYNANAATLLASLEMGIAGYSGVMANFHPDIYAWLVKHWKEQPSHAKKVQQFLGFSSLTERQLYPVNAKYFLTLEGLKLSLYTRARDQRELHGSLRLEIEQFYALSKTVSERIKG